MVPRFLFLELLLQASETKKAKRTGQRTQQRNREIMLKNNDKKQNKQKTMCTDQQLICFRMMDLLQI